MLRDLLIIQENTCIDFGYTIVFEQYNLEYSCLLSFVFT